MATWITLPSGTIHRVDREMPAGVITACDQAVPRRDIVATEVDGCPEDDPRLCRECREEWRR